MSFVNEVQRVVSALRLDGMELGDGQLGATALVRAGSELIGHCPDESDGGHSFRTLLRWVQVADPKAVLRDARRVVDGSHPAKDPLWLASLNFDARYSRAFPTALVIAGLIAMIPSTHSQLDATWSYIRLAAGYTGVSADRLEMLRGWLTGAASESVTEQVTGLLADLEPTNPACAAVVAVLREQARLSSSGEPSQGVPPFLEARRMTVARTDDALRHAGVLHLDRTGLTRLRDYADHDFFRIAVLGEFKRGKSTLVNALVEAPDLMPTDFLPCTSALTELRYGGEPRFLRYDVETQSYEPAEESDFRGNVSLAATVTSERVNAEAEAQAVSRWRVLLPSSFLREDFVELVDSPGLGEDPARDFIAKDESLRADAAILVFSAGMLAGQSELDLVVHMQAKLGNLIIAINLADQVAESQWPRLREHIARRLEARRLPVPAERIVFVSARNAENAIREGRVGDPWVERVRDLRRVVRDHLLRRSGPLKAAYLAARIDEVVKRGREDIARAVTQRRDQLQKIDQLETNHQRASEARRNAQASIERATAKLRQHKRMGDALVSAFETALPTILAGVQAGSDQWTTDHNPLFSPQKHVNAVGEKAVQAVRDALEAWFKGFGKENLESSLVAKLDTAAADVSDLAEYLRMVKGGSEGDREAFFEDLKQRALQDAYSDATREAVGVNAIGRSVVLAVVSLVVGYIIADVVLFYVFSAIIGFLAIPLLVAAAVIGVLGGWTKGDALARSWIRSTIFEKIREQFQKEEAREKLRTGIDRAMRDVCVRIALSFRLSCNQYLDEARVQEQRVYEELTAFAKGAGDRSSLEAELRRIEAAAAETRAAYAALEGVARQIRQEPTA